jgi:hypothetical protein
MKMLDLFSDPFHPDIFLDHNLYQEWQFCDRKAEIYVFKGEKLSPKKRFDFTKDVIAAANMSYHFGKDSLFLFGVHNDMTIYRRPDKNIVGMLGQSTNLKYLSGVDWNSETSINLLFEKIQRDITDLAKNNISPNMIHLVLKHGKVNFPFSESVLLAYLVVRAEQTNKKGYLAERKAEYNDDNGKIFIIEPGQAFYRLGENNAEMSVEEFEYWKSNLSCPEISGQSWKKYLGTFKINEIKGYQEPHIYFDQKEYYLHDFILNTFLTNNQRLLIIEGRAGMGKTKFLELLATDRAKNAEAFVDEKRINSLPNIHIPIFKTLLGTTFRKDKHLSAYIVEWINSKGKFYEGKMPMDLPGILQRKDSLWILCLDGLDELENNSLNVFLVLLDEFLSEHTQVKVIITARTDAILEKWRDERIVLTIRDLNEREISNYLSSKIPDKYLGYANRLIAENFDLNELIHTALYLEAYCQAILIAPGLLPNRADSIQDNLSTNNFSGSIEPEKLLKEYGSISQEEIDLGPDNLSENLDSSEKPVSEENNFTNERDDEDDFSDENEIDIYVDLRIVFDNMVRHIWKHDRKHFHKIKDTESTEEPLNYLNKLALKADGNRRYDVDASKSIIKSKITRNRFLSLGFLEIRGAFFWFPNLSLQAYLAAQNLDSLISRSNPQKLENLIRGKRNDFWNNTEAFLKVIVTNEEVMGLFDQLN